MLACSIESRPEPRSCRSVKIDLGGGGGRSHLPPPLSMPFWHSWANNVCALYTILYPCVCACVCEKRRRQVSAPLFIKRQERRRKTSPGPLLSSLPPLSPALLASLHNLWKSLFNIICSTFSSHYLCSLSLPLISPPLPRSAKRE